MQHFPQTSVICHGQDSPCQAILASIAVFLPNTLFQKAESLLVLSPFFSISSSSRRDVRNPVPPLVLGTKMLFGAQYYLVGLQGHCSFQEALRFSLVGPDDRPYHEITALILHSFIVNRQFYVIIHHTGQFLSCLLPELSPYSRLIVNSQLIIYSSTFLRLFHFLLGSLTDIHLKWSRINNVGCRLICFCGSQANFHTVRLGKSPFYVFHPLPQQPFEPLHYRLAGASVIRRYWFSMVPFA